MYNVLVVDDDPTQAQGLADLVKASSYGPACTVSVSTAGHIGSIDPSEVDVLLTDIVLQPGGDLLGIDLVSRYFENGRCQVIYVTGYDDFYERVYGTEHVYLLRKPVDGERLQKALDKAFERLESAEERPLTLLTGHVYRSVLPSSILYVESDRRVLTVHSDEGDVRTYGKLSDLLSLLPPHFVQTHKSYVVNLERARSVDAKSVELDSGDSVPVAQRRWSCLRESFLAYMRSAPDKPAVGEAR